MGIFNFFRIFSVCAPIPKYVIHPQLQNTCQYIVNHYVQKWQVSGGGGGENNMHPLSLGGGGTNGKDLSFHTPVFCYRDLEIARS